MKNERERNLLQDKVKDLFDQVNLQEIARVNLKEIHSKEKMKLSMVLVKNFLKNKSKNLLIGEMIKIKRVVSK
jgi:hypothetical protein